MFDIITIGSATQDIFIETDKSKILNLKEITEQKNWLCFDYGEKIDIDRLAFDVGGGAVNAAVNFSTQGFNTATIAKIGKDLNAKAVKKRLEEQKVSKSLLIKTEECNTGFSVILTSFEGDRTVLAHRGTNGTICHSEIPWDEIKHAKWIYIAPLSKESNKVLDKLADFAEESGVNMAFNPGTTSINRGIEKLKRIFSTAEVLLMNKSEAAQVTEMPERPETKHDKQVENKIINSHTREMLKKLKSYNPKIVVITDGKKGVYAYDGDYFYQSNTFPADVISTLGAGDAFSSTFVASLIKSDWNIEKSIQLAAINSASVVESFGAQSGLKSLDELENILAKHPDFKVNKITEKELVTT